MATGGTSQMSLMESALVCGICLSEFDATLRRPLILPKCGHTYCRICVKNLAAHGEVTCPSCRCLYQGCRPRSPSYQFQCSVFSQLDSHFQCGSRNLPIDADISPPPPSFQYTESRDTDCKAHGVRLAFWCKTCETAACGECLFEQHPRPDHNTCRIQEVVKQIKDLAEKLSQESCVDIVVRLGEAIRGTLGYLSDLQEAAHLLQETARVNLSAMAAQDLLSITSVYETAKSVRQRVSALDRSQDQRDNSTALASSKAASTRPAILALSDNGSLARVQVEEKGIHLYSLRPPSTAYSVAIKLNVLTACVSKESPTVFLDISAGERRLGRIYIILEGKMRRAQQFMSLCLGNLGFSYRNTRFDGLSERGQPGEYIRGGDYQGRGGHGGEALMDNLEWGGTWVKPKAAGQVCGVGGEEQRKFGSLFAICLKDNPEDTFKCPFGVVTEGLQVLEVASRHDPFNVVHINDCGVMIPL
ncbi:RING finger protein 207-like [Penaeus japonicus]|uniref:RING finger protein 207-like n=1 Tax=Penaeus japonicus TaxID=27405 RepID=UPI001C713C5A|nr:RING finger protein 207-like [Penaeus japonicus]